MKKEKMEGNNSACPEIKAHILKNEFAKYTDGGKTSANSEAPRTTRLTTGTLVWYTLVNLNLKILLHLMFRDSLTRYPHFQTPLSSLSNAKEAINHHQANGKLYYADPNSVHQPILTLKILEIVLTYGSQRALLIWFYL